MNISKNFLFIFVLLVGIVILSYNVYSYNDLTQKIINLNVTVIIGQGNSSNCKVTYQEIDQEESITEYVINDSVRRLYIKQENLRPDENITEVVALAENKFKENSERLEEYFERIPVYREAYYNLNITMIYRPLSSYLNNGMSCFTDSNGYIEMGNLNCGVHEILHNLNGYYGLKYLDGIPSCVCLSNCTTSPSCTYKDYGYPIGVQPYVCRAGRNYQGVVKSNDIGHNILDRIGDNILRNNPFPLESYKCSMEIKNCADVFGYTEVYPDQIGLVSCLITKVKGQNITFELLAKYSWDCGVRTDRDTEMHNACEVYGK